MNCDNKTTPPGQSVTNRFSGGDDGANVSSTASGNNTVPVRVAGLPLLPNRINGSQSKPAAAAATGRPGEKESSRGKRGKINSI